MNGGAGQGWFGDLDLFVADVDVDGSRRELADVLVGHRPRRGPADAVGELRELLHRYPGCVLVLVPLSDGRWLAGDRAGRLFAGRTAACEGAPKSRSLPGRHRSGSASSSAPSRRASSTLMVELSARARR